MPANNEKPYLRLGINIDHVATIRNARGGAHPDPVAAAKLAAEAGADGITAHLREDRRHISDADIELLSTEIDKPLNLEMAATDEMLAIALRHAPHAVCLVPEKRQELTTEGGLDVAAGHNHLAPYVTQLGEAGMRVSLFVDADPVQLAVAKALNAAVVELHAGAYCDAFHASETERADHELKRLIDGAKRAADLGLEVHAGHGLTYETVPPLAVVPEIVELNIGHYLVGEAIFRGFGPAISEMRKVMDAARNEAVQ